MKTEIIKKFHLKTDETGCTQASISEDSVCLPALMDREANLKPETDYEVSIVEMNSGTSDPCPELPKGYREITEDEMAIASPPKGTMVADKHIRRYSEWTGPLWPRMSNGFWVSVIVPADWSPLPKCWNCGKPTRIAEVYEEEEEEEEEDLSGGPKFLVECSSNPLGCTSGPLRANKIDAVEGYPRK